MKALYCTLVLAVALHSHADVAEQTRPATIGTETRMLRFDVPVSWASRVRPTGIPTLIATAPGRRVEVLITPLPLDLSQARTGADVRKWVDGAAEVVQPTAVEPKLEVQAIEGMLGYYFTATDREPGKGFKYMAQGAFLAGQTLVTFTILSHEEPPEGFARPMAIISSAKLQ